MAEISSGGSAPQGEFYFGGKNFFIRVSHIDNTDNSIKAVDLITDEAVRKYKLRKYPKGTIVFPKSGATIYLEKRAQLPFDAYIVSHLCAVISNKENLKQDFLFYVLLKTKFAEKKGDGYPTLTLSEIKQFHIPLPPLPEQKAIAEVLMTIQEAKEKTEAVIKATKELKKSMMKHLFTYGVDGVGELKETEIGLIPKHWQVVRLGEVLNKNSRSQISDLRNYSKIPFIPMSLIPEENVFIDSWEERKPDEIRSGILILEGDLLLAKITPCFENGKKGIVRNLPNGFGYATTEVIPIRTTNELNNIFLTYYLSIGHVREYLAQKMEGTTGRKRLPKLQIENLLIPLPLLPEQQAIAEILQAIDEKIQKEEAKKQAIENLFKTMLSNLMSGKLRVRRVEELESQ